MNNASPGQRDPPYPLALAARPRAGRADRRACRPRGAHAAVPSLGSRDRAARRVAQSRHRIGCGKDRGRRGRVAQCDIGKPDGTGDRADGAQRGPVCAGKGLHSRGHRDKQPIHAGCFVSSGRAQASRTGIQPRGRAAARRPAIASRHCASGSFRDCGSRSGGRRGVDPQAQRRLGHAAHCRIWIGLVVLAQDPPRILCRR